MGSSFHLRDLVRNDETLLNKLYNGTFSVTDRKNPLTTFSHNRQTIDRQTYSEKSFLLSASFTRYKKNPTTTKNKQTTIVLAENGYKNRLH